VAAASNTGLTLTFGTSTWNPWGQLSFQAPAGQQLAVGTYTGAFKAGSNGSAPGLDLTFNSINNHGCSSITGSFTIYQYAVGAGGSIDSLNATFDQVCESGPGETRGRVLINVAGPPVPAVTASTAATGLVTTGRVGGLQATVWGTITCTQAGQITVTGSVIVWDSDFMPLSSTATCAPGSAFPWSASGASPFPPSPGGGTVIFTAQGAFDPYYLINPTAYVAAHVQFVQPAPPSCITSRCTRVSPR
jgi:hypothetical protein